MLFSIILIVSVLTTLLLVYLIRLPFEKKPLYIVILISGFTVLFSYITSQTLSSWLGILFFFGIIISSTILLGKRKEWLVKKEEIVEISTPKRNFHKITKHFENPMGRSIYDEEKSPLYIPKANIDEDSTIIEDVSFEDFLLKKKEDEITYIEDHHIELESEVKSHVLEITMPKMEPEITREPIVPVSSYESTLQEATKTDIGIDLKLNKEEPQYVGNYSAPIDDVEELSDKWMARRLDALLASEENNSSKLFQEMPEEEVFLPNLNDFTNSKEVPKIEQDKGEDFEDISALYFNKQRSDIDGTKEY